MHTTRRGLLAAAVALPVLPTAADTDDEPDGAAVERAGDATVRTPPGYTFAGPGDRHNPPPDSPRFRS